MKKTKSGSALVWLLILVLLAGIGYYIYYSINSQKLLADQPASVALASTTATSSVSAKPYFTFPIGGETLVIGKKYTIKWTGSEKGVNKYPVYLMKGSGNSTKTISKLGVGYVSDKSLTFKVPSIAEGTDYRVQLGSDPVVARSKVFTISKTATTTKASISITEPFSGQVLTVGEAYNIKWVSTGSDASKPVTIQLQRKSPKDSQFWNIGTISLSQPGTGTFAWTIPEKISAHGYSGDSMNDVYVAGSSYKILIGRGLDSGLGQAATSGAFSINIPVYVISSITTRLSPNTPASRIVTVSPDRVTSNVVMGVFSIKSDKNTIIKDVGFNFYGIPDGPSVLSNIKLSVGGQTYGGNALSAGKTTFTNMNASLLADQWTDFVVSADIAKSGISSGVIASTTLIASSVKSDSKLDLSNAANVTSNNVAFVGEGVYMSNASAYLGSAVTGLLYGNVFGTVGYNTKFQFTLTNNGNNNVYVSKDANKFVTAEIIVNGAKTIATSTMHSIATPNALPSDTSTTYAIPVGSSRTFSLSGILMKPSSASYLSILRITSINFESATSPITSGLDALYVNATF